MVTKPDLFHGLCVKEPHDNKNKPMPYALCQSQIMANPDINSRKAWARNANAYLCASKLSVLFCICEKLVESTWYSM